MAKEGLLDEVDPWYWAYFAGFFVMILLGLLVQCNHYRAEKRRAAAVKHPYLIQATQEEVILVDKSKNEVVVVESANVMI